MTYLRSLDASDWIAAGAVLVAVIAAVISAWQARIARTSADKQLDLAERVHREANEPYVIVDVQPREPWSFVFVVVVENVGPTVARNVRISVTPELESSQGADVGAELREALARTIPVIPRADASSTSSTPTAGGGQGFRWSLSSPSPRRGHTAPWRRPGTSST